MALSMMDPFWGMSMWDPWWDLRNMRREMDRMMGSTQIWWPAVDVSETDREFRLRAELPGMKKEDINIELRGNMLCISGEKKEEKKEENERYRRVERNWGRFSRSFMVPEGLKENQIKAKFENGVLEVCYPKLGLTGREEPKRIAVA